MADERATVEAAREAFDRDFEKFSDLNPNGSGLAGLEASLREVGDLKVRHTGKKSALAEAKKLIGRVAPEERGEFGQFVQAIERSIVERIESVESNLHESLSKARIEGERLFPAGATSLPPVPAPPSRYLPVSPVRPPGRR